MKLAVMCPTSAVWQETQRTIARRMYDELGVDAIYLDQIAAMQPVLCADPAHSHRSGGGSWWTQGYNNFMDHMRRVKPRDGAYTTECNGEQYMRYLDGYLTWHFSQAGYVPAFAAVYAGYIPMFGRNYESARDDVGFRFLLCHSLLSGEQMGWLYPRVYLESPFRDLYKKAVRARYKWRSFFYAGRMLKPPRVSSDVPDMTTPAIMGGANVITVSAVGGSRWQRLGGEESILILINIADESARTKLSLTGVSGLLDFSGDVSQEVELRDGKCTLTLPPLSVAVARIEEGAR